MPVTGLKIVGTVVCLPWGSISSSFFNSLKTSGHRSFEFQEFLCWNLVPFLPDIGFQLLKSLWSSLMYFLFNDAPNVLYRWKIWTAGRPIQHPDSSTISAFPLHGTARDGTVRYGSLFGGFPLGTVPGTWYFFSTTSVEVPSEPYRYQNMTRKLCWSLIGRRKSSLLRHWTCDTRPSSTALPARFKSAQPAKDRTQLLFKQTHLFASTAK